jgi:hypothetical protein
LLDHLVMTYARDLAADMVAVMTDTPGALPDRLERHLDALDEETLAAVGDALPLRSLTLMELSLRIRRKYIAECQQAGAAPEAILLERVTQALMGADTELD